MEEKCPRYKRVSFLPAGVRDARRRFQGAHPFPLVPVLVFSRSSTIRNYDATARKLVSQRLVFYLV